MRISRLSPRYADELIEIAQIAEDACEIRRLDGSHEKEMRKILKVIAKDLRSMVKDNEKFLNE